MAATPRGYRRSRSSFTRTLERICRRLDEQAVYVVQWRDFFGHRVRGHIRICGLWVAGSYARGALECGDLDLILDVAADENGIPPESTISRAALGSPPDVRVVHLGSRERFPEAIKIWSDGGLDWSHAIRSIAPDETAGRFERPTDIIPFRPEQLAESWQALNEVVVLYEQRSIAWQFVTFDSHSFGGDSRRDDEEALMKYVRQWRGKETQRLLPFLFRAFRDHNPCGRWSLDWFEKSQFRCGGAEVFVGRPRVRLSCLDQLGCSQVAIAPHISRRGPNGVWIVNRGEQHRVEQSFTGRFAYYLQRDGCPILFTEQPGDWRETAILNLFTSHEEAQDIARREREGFDEPKGGNVERAMGHDLLRLISGADILDVAGQRLPLTPKGLDPSRGETLATPDQLLQILPRWKKY